MQITIRDPGSAFTHYIALLLSLFAAIPLMIKASSNEETFASVAIFMLSMILLYAASTTYHTVNIPQKYLRLFRKLDHMMIFVLIAGTYTPICLTVLKDGPGLILLAAVWIIALIGMYINILWITCPKWISSVIYIAMGWICVFVFSELLHTLPLAGFLWLLIGGIIYTIGGIIYALKLPLFNNRHKYFGSHEIFHLFVMAGSFCHYIFMYMYIA